MPKPVGPSAGGSRPSSGSPLVVKRPRLVERQVEDYLKRPKLAGRPPANPAARAAWEQAVKIRQKEKNAEIVERVLEREGKSTAKQAAKVLPGMVAAAQAVLNGKSGSRRSAIGDVPHADPKSKVLKPKDKIIADGRERIGVLVDLAKSAAAGLIHAAIATGGPGIGKSHNIVRHLEHLHEHKNTKWTILKSRISPVELYRTLWEHQETGNVVVLDDADVIFANATALNLLKAALDTPHKRKISWKAANAALRKDDIPTEFYFYGSVIFITNLPLREMAQAQTEIGRHMSAVVDRVHYIDLKMRGRRERAIWTEYVVNRYHPLMGNCGHDEINLSKDDEAMLLKWLLDRVHDIPGDGLSLRTIVKIAKNYVGFPGSWERMSELTILEVDDQWATEE